MKFKNILKGLAKLALIPIIAGSLGSCKKDYSLYNYNGMLGNDAVRFEHIPSLRPYYKAHNEMVAIKPDGTNKLYKDSENNDLKIEYIFEITPENKFFTYDKGKELEMGQKEFDDYLRAIESQQMRKQLEETLKVDVDEYLKL